MTFKPWHAVIGIATLLAALLAIVLVYVVSSYNQANTYEQALKAEKENNRNILSNYGKKIVEAAQVPAMMRDDFLKIVNAQMQGRYGEKGSTATFQWIQEQNLPLDSAVYTRIQSLVESGRNEFRQGQTKLVSVKQSYNTALGSMPKGFVLGLLGFPRIDLREFDIVSDDRTENAFSTKREDALHLR